MVRNRSLLPDTCCAELPARAPSNSPTWAAAPFMGAAAKQLRSEWNAEEGPDAPESIERCAGGFRPEVGRGGGNGKSLSTLRPKPSSAIEPRAGPSKASLPKGLAMPCERIELGGSPLFSLTRAAHPTPAEQTGAGLRSRRRHGSPRLRLSDRRLPQREIALGRRSARSFTAQASLSGMRSLGCEPGNRFSTEFQPRCLSCSTRASCDGWGRSIDERSAKTRAG